MFELKVFLQEYKKNKKKNKARYNIKFLSGLFLIFLIYSLSGLYIPYNWKINTMCIIIIFAYITIWNATHPTDDEKK